MSPQEDIENESFVRVSSLVTTVGFSLSGHRTPRTPRARKNAYNDTRPPSHTSNLFRSHVGRAVDHHQWYARTETPRPRPKRRRYIGSTHFTAQWRARAYRRAMYALAAVMTELPAERKIFKVYGAFDVPLDRQGPEVDPRDDGDKDLGVLV